MTSVRNIAAGAAAFALLASSAFADTAAPVAAPLAPGKPAGVHQAQMENATLMWIGLGAVVAAAVLVASTNGNNHTTTTTTGTTP